jgi:dUTP pyrophosphatase
MKIKIKKIEKDLPLPEYKTPGAVAFDFYARKTITIEPQTVGYVPLNNIIEIPEEYGLIVAARSGTHKKGLMLVNSIGVIDPLFCGEDDEILAAYFNFSVAPVIVERGERIAQGFFLKREFADWDEVETMKKESRGGFGSTGHK